MSKNITILEGSTSKQFGNVAKIRTSVTGGGTTNWVPEDEVELTSLSVDEDGTYYASDEGYYGYDRVTVRGIGSATFTAEEGDVLGGDPLEPNEPYALDEEGVHLLPSSIAFTRQPAQVIYQDGDTIRLDGAIVQAFKNDGEVWTSEDYPQGAIPYSELVLEPSIASTGGQSSESIFSNGGVKAFGILCDEPGNNSYSRAYYYPHSTGFNGSTYNFYARNYTVGYMYFTKYNGHVYIAYNERSHAFGSVTPDGKGGMGTGPIVNGVQSYTTFMDMGLISNVGLPWIDNIPTSEVNPVGVDFVNPEKIGTEQTINVIWHRYKDGAELTTSFVVQVEGGSTTHITDGEEFGGGGGNF